VKKNLPIGIDSFREIRETDRYYIDKTLFIRDFIQAYDKVSLITRPRRFGKTLNLTMLMEFFDITTDSKAIFEGLGIMNTEYADQINSRPVIYYTFKDCKANNVKTLLFIIGDVILSEYRKYAKIFKGNVKELSDDYLTFFMIYEKLIKREIDIEFLMISIITLEQAVYEYYKIKPILLIDEYDQPILSSFENGYHDQLKDFFAGFYGAALKGQYCLHQALLTGIQRIVKESIFSQLNNIVVYTVLDKCYSSYFGLTSGETEELLASYGMVLDEAVKQKYDGYLFGEVEIYNPWSLLNYAKSGELRNYWINTSTNYLIKKSINEADELFRKYFEKLISDGAAKIATNLECSFIELKSRYTLWGLLINSGYLTVIGQADGIYMNVRIPNGEVQSEFAGIVADQANVQGEGLHEMFRCLFEQKMDAFLEIYSELVISCTSYFDAKENAYHMLFLGMCISLNNLYKITSNIESGFGRSDIIMESLSIDRPHIIIEFKQGGAASGAVEGGAAGEGGEVGAASEPGVASGAVEDDVAGKIDELDVLKEAALRQILDKRYYSNLHGDILCVGIAHNKKKCCIAHQVLKN